MLSFTGIGVALLGVILARHAAEGGRRWRAGLRERRLSERDWVGVLLGLAALAFLLSLGPVVAFGDGMIDAAIAAISEATGVTGKVGNFQVASVTGGSDALGAVAITVEARDRKVTGRGVATDVVEASARAYLNAVNKIVRLEARNDVREVEEVGP